MGTQPPQNPQPPRSKKWKLWGIGAFVGFLWAEDVSPTFDRVGRPVILAAIEYALIAYLMRVAGGFGRASYDELQQGGVLKGLGLILSGCGFVAFGFYFLSVCIMPGSPWYLISRPRGQAAFLVLLSAGLYGFFSQRRDCLRNQGSSPRVDAGGMIHG